MSEREQDALVRRCLDLGINLFDTAAGYRRSEEILGRALEGVPRDTYVIATKWGHETDGVLAEDPDALVRSTDESLRRLRTDHIDVMLFHLLMTDTYHEVVERFYPVMRRLREMGKIRAIGFSERFVDDPGHEAAVMALKTHPQLWDTIMLKYGILNQYAAREALPLALEHGVGITNMAAVRRELPRPALLEEQIAEWRRRGVIPADSLPERDSLGWLVHDDVDSVISAGYRFAADHPAVSSVLTGTSSVEHLESNVAALETPVLAESDKRRLRDLFGEVAEYV